MRCFVIGNGPSLNKTPLDRLAGETTFAVNRIHLIYPRTTWRPTYWALGDRSNSPHYKEDIRTHLEFGYQCYVRSDFYKDVPAMKDDWPNLTLFPKCEHIDAERHTATEWHEPFCNFAGSTPIAIQLAVKLGFDEIYVLGCDLGYKGNMVNHFDPNYGDVDNVKVPDAILANKTSEMGHRIAYRECQKRGVRIFNATIGGALAAYPRVKLEAVLAN